MEKITDYKAGRIVLILIFCLYIFAIGSINATASQDDMVQNDSLATASVEKVPVIIELSYPIAGAEFKFSHTDGLEFRSFEKSEETNSALVTPVAEKNDSLHVGFFAAENNYAPQNGELLVGYLVFDYNGEPAQSVTITETKLVQVINEDTTASEVLSNSITIDVPGDGNLTVGNSNNNMLFLIIIAIVIIVAIILLRKRMLAKGPVE